MRFACQRRPRGAGGGESARRGEDLMMMYRGRAAERRESGPREGAGLGLRSPGATKGEFKHKKRERRAKKSELVEEILGLTLQVEARYFIRCSRAI